ncbi:hypothetical protein AM501_27060 [Aneurinibacillus migulanus]|uniref:Cytosolic protein n=1 Tax=Aneurinibacillus migulanus TaxID=47500 RepID=A0A0D1WCG7_ANEMI|nr:hypothetical protein [Aneurinibacillus migulanus]KIV56260.1 hypothetical protein TS65_13705 [Aneurinibacillus migulanus]KIV56986.1 hypothetical protein TS64_08115 [Aneurinibacillus migulanus]KON84330.1 hypothetical protein AF333_30855 [Aneurinibacillus migulanus]KPD05232.1 hypothetical protein AM501_27060 [Aneurinibacillus migulanus]MCP1357145.1 hypothetical protein [Aneurinibacillus migulanus]
MYVGRKLDELSDMPIAEWEMKELLYHHDMMSEMAPFLNTQGISYHHKIIEEVEKRGGVPSDEGAWDHSSRIIYD